MGAALVTRAVRLALHPLDPMAAPARSLADGTRPQRLPPVRTATEIGRTGRGADVRTPAYLIGAIQTDAGLVAGIGGCTNRALTRNFARWTRTYAYEFDPVRGPG